LFYEVTTTRLESYENTRREKGKKLAKYGKVEISAQDHEKG